MPPGSGETPRHFAGCCSGRATSRGVPGTQDPADETAGHTGRAGREGDRRRRPNAAGQRPGHAKRPRPTCVHACACACACAPRETRPRSSGNRVLCGGPREKEVGVFWVLFLLLGPVRMQQLLVKVRGQAGTCGPGALSLGVSVLLAPCRSSARTRGGALGTRSRSALTPSSPPLQPARARVTSP